MNCQGLLGALIQYWNIEEKPRLHRKNSYFEDHQLSNYDALRIGLAVSVIGTGIILFWCLMGMVL